MNVMATDGTVPAWGHVAALGRQLRERRHRARAFGRVLWRHKLLILACLGIVLGLTAAYVSTLAPAYEAEALVAVARPDRPDGQGVATQDGTAEDQLRLIEFRALAERLAERLNLQLLPEFRPEHAPRDVREVGGWLPHALIDRLPQAWADPLTGRPARALTDAQRAARLWDAVIAATMARTRAEVTGSSAIGFKFVSEDPQLAAAGANALAELYLEQRPALQRNAPQSDRDELAQEIARLRAAIRDTEQAIAAARPGADAQASGSAESRLDLAGELAFWRRERAELEARLRQSQAALESDAELAQTALARDSERLGQLQASAKELQETLTVVSQQSGEQAPEVAELRAQLAAVEQERRAELEGTLKRLQDEMAIIQSRETALEEKIKALGEEDAAGERPDGLSALKQKLEADRALLRDRLDQAARLEARPAAPQGAARAITPAAVPIRPAYPRLALIWGAAASGALILGVVLALALEAFPGGRA
jgi:uncharacterized protein involved in exopolysaccharide biosynthesis